MFSESKLKGLLSSICLGSVCLLSGFQADSAKAETQVRDVMKNYADIAYAGYEDSLITAKKLQTAIDAFLASPNEKTLNAAKEAWLASRVPYMQTEAYRFGNKIVDDWEGKVNAWPLDEGLIDYVDSGQYGADGEENTLYAANVIANETLKIDGKTIDARNITKALLTETLHEAGGVEANVATGYHAIEFLLWGQDLNGTKAGAGQRKASDYDVKNCTGGRCERRIAYLKTVTALLVDDLAWMVRQWAPDGEARREVLKASGSDGLKIIFTGLGSLTYGEMAGERIRLGLLLHDPEEEHDCFSDNTHNSHYYDILGIQNVYLGTYKRIDGTAVSGPSASDLVKQKDEATDATVRKAISVSVAKAQALKARAETVERYDQMLALGNKDGNATVQAVVDALVLQARQLERAIAALKLEAVNFEGSDSLDDPGKVEGADKELLSNK